MLDTDFIIVPRVHRLPSYFSSKKYDAVKSFLPPTPHTQGNTLIYGDIADDVVFPGDMSRDID